MPGRRELVSSHALLISVPPTRVLAAFFDPIGIPIWWQAVRAITTPRPLGVYAVEWAATDFRDDVLGPLGGVFYGTVMEYKAGREFFVAGAHWLPPEGEPLGPMALEVSCALQTTPSGATHSVGTLLRVVQRGFDTSERGQRYHEIVDSGWQRALESLREYLERGR